MRTLWMVIVCSVVVVLVTTPVRAGPEDGRTAHKSGDPERAYELWKPLAERGEREAQFRLGMLYEKGEGVKRDLAEAHKWYVLAWKRKHAHAQRRTVALRKRMTKPQFQDSLRRIRDWIKAFEPQGPDGVKGPERGGLRLVQKEISRKTTNGITHVCYRIDATGLDRGKKYRMWMMDLGLAVVGRPEVAISDGPLEVEGWTFCLERFRRGEWYRLKVTSLDGTQVAETTLVPFPLEARQGRCRIWLQLMDASGRVFTAQGEGFEPNEEVTVVSRSNGEVIRGKEWADVDGELHGVLFPAAGKRRHKSSWSVIRKSGTLTIH